MSGNIYHSWNGTVLTITSDSGTSSADLRGSTGIRGAQGIPGIITDTTGKINLAGLATQEELAAKQNQLIAGNNIEINNDVISATGDVKEEDFKELKRSLDYLWKLNQGISYQFENRDYNTYNINVPTGAKIAAINKIGGMTRKCTNLYNGGDLSFTQSTLITLGKPLKAGTYTLSCICTSTDTSYTTNLVSFVNGNGDGQNFNITLTRGTKVSRSVTLTSPVSQIRFNSNKDYSSSAGYDATFTNIMLNEGSTALPYEPYFEGLRSASVREFESVGANLFDLSKFIASGVVHGTVTVSGDSMQISTPASSNNVRSVKTLRTLAPELVAGETYILNFDTTSKQYSYCYGTGEKWDIGQPKVVTDAMLDGTIAFYADDKSSTATISNIMLNRGSTALPYTPYRKPVTISIPEAIKAIDGYGDGLNETVYNYVDWENGKFVKNVGKVDMGTLTWRINSEATPAVFFASIEDIVISHSRTTSVLCANYVPADVSQDTTTMPSKTFMRGYGDKKLLFVKDEDFINDVNGFKASLSGNMLYYELAEPEIIDITNVLKIDNILDVEANGIITPVNDFEYDVPTNIEYLVSLAEVSV